MLAIETKGLSKKFDKKTAVKQLNLEIKEGELFSLLGVNGAGKTTTIRMLSGLSQPSGGEAFIFGKSIRHKLQEVKRVINLSPQETAIAMNLTVRENLMLMAEIYGFAKEKARAKVEEVIGLFSLEEVADTKASILSGGWQRRLSIAMALITEPKVLFLDEPTLGLDVLARRELWKLIMDLKGKITIILTTHYMEESEVLSDRIGVMMKGEVKAIGTLKELKALTGKENLEEAFVAVVEGRNGE
ncbi:MAG TPA: ATP-binding cassette domain-containing protein [Clostridiales bacterium]|nr:ATP-binding cassette domain-containing protein [Clostridiales bacterium]